MITLLDYGAGNIRSVVNAVRHLGFEVRMVQSPEEIVSAERLIFPGVGNFGQVMSALHDRGYIEPLFRRISEDRPILGICVALQTLFAASEESPGIAGLAVIPGTIKKFCGNFAVPQMGWNGLKVYKKHPVLNGYSGQRLYFVHSYYAEITRENKDWLLTGTDYGGEFISGVSRGNLTAFQFHPEKSGQAGLALLHNFLAASKDEQLEISTKNIKTQIAKRVIACLDVRTNDAGDLVVTKGDQYEVREQGEVRNYGKPVAIARRYYEEGADEITFLNITGFRDFPIQDQPMLEVLRRTSEKVFVPLTVGGGIRAFTDAAGRFYSALEVASVYFRSGADKVSIGSEAVAAAQEYLASGGRLSGGSAIEQISRAYGNQAVVISVDPRRVYVQSPDDTGHAVIETNYPGPDGERYCWYQCTVKGGREGRDIDVVQLAAACEKMGAGE
ncbi:MAG: imidazole glycerol phosphate synthase subunit HisH, partial [Deltaproteobacteria bacterium]